jgi:hypothetical protein
MGGEMRNLDVYDTSASPLESGTGFSEIEIKAEEGEV